MNNKQISEKDNSSKRKYSIDDQEVVEMIGKGSFGKVQKVKSKIDQKIQVQKEIFQGEMNRREQQQMLNELNIMQTVEHPNVCKQHHYIIDKDKKNLYIVMEFCEEGDLSILIRRLRKENRRIEEGTVWKIFTQILQAIEFLHSQDNKILHRDIKPGNIFLQKGGAIKLGDFGLSRQFSENSVQAMSHVGTPQYMSPEQVNQIKQDEKCDIWALGCLLHEMATLQPPFQAKNQVQLAQKIRSGKIENMPNPEQQSKEICRVIEWCLQTDTTRRPSAAQLIGIPRVSNILKTIKLKNMHSQVNKLNEKNDVLEKELDSKKAICTQLEDQQANKKKYKIRIDEKVALLKKLKEDFERELARNSNKSSNNDLFSTEALSYDSDKINWNQ